jgi:hypothetical protein
MSTKARDFPREMRFSLKEEVKFNPKSTGE